MRVYRVITFLFPLIIVKLSVDFEFSYDQLDPVSLHSALWTDWISHLTFYFAWSRLHIAREFGTERTAVIRIKKWRIMTRKKSPSTSVKRALFELSLVWLESLINCLNVWKPSIDSQTLSSPISFTPIIYGSRISNTIFIWTEQSEDLKIIDVHFSKMSIIHQEWLFSRTWYKRKHIVISAKMVAGDYAKQKNSSIKISLITCFVDWHRSNFLINVLH